MKCCPNCFGNSYLRKKLGTTGERGTCSFCKTRDADLHDPSTLRDAFELVTGVYIRDDGGKPLADWLREDWAMFASLDAVHVKELLAEILDDGEIVRQNFIPSPLSSSDTLDRWEKFRNELMYTNRFFPEMLLKTRKIKGASFLPAYRQN
jgi:hypothetical protein